MFEHKGRGSTQLGAEGAEEAGRTRWAFWLAWVSVTVVGAVAISGLAFALTALLGHVGLGQGDSSTEYLVVLPAVSLSVGLMQWLILHHHIRRAGWWVVAAAISSAVSGVLLGDPGSPSYPAPYMMLLFLGVPMAVILGSVTAGLVQWLILRRQARLPGLYVAVGAVGWGVALAVAAITFFGTLSIGLGPALTVWGAVCGVVYGAITAWMLAVLLPNPREPGPRSLLFAGGAVTLVVALMTVHFLSMSMTEEKLLRQYQAGKLDFSGASLRQANLPEVSLRGVVLRRADLREVNLEGADLSGAILTVADLSYANLRGADLSLSDLRGASLRGAGLTNASLREANLGSVAGPESPCPDDRSGAGMRAASPQAMVLSTAGPSAVRWLCVGPLGGSAMISHLALFEPSVCYTDLRDADLGGADLTGANLSWAWLQRANLEGAILDSANLHGAMVTDEQLSQAKSLEGTTLPDGTVHD